MNATRPLRILSVEDDPNDAELIREVLESEHITAEVARVDTEAAFLAAIRGGGVDVILADYTLPSFDGISALRLALQVCPDIPFLFVSGTLGEEVAIEALKIGAVDYVLKNKLARLAPSLRRALRESKERTERRLSDERLRRSEAYLAEAQRLTRCGTWAWNVRTNDLFWSREMFRLFDYDPGHVKPSIASFLERVHSDDRAAVDQRATGESTGAGKSDSLGDYRVVLGNGETRHIHSIAHSVTNEAGEIVEVVGTAVDVTEQHNSRVALQAAFEEIKTLKDRLQSENIALREEIDRSSMFEEIVGDSAALKTVLDLVVRVAPTDSTVLITGETGTGKELIARAIHKRSARSERPFVSVNCAAIPATLIPSELFGHEKGAFTGAVQRRIGRFELAEGGTIFLDEVGELPPDTQVALLRVLQEREFERVGGGRPIRVNLRIIAATNRDLEREIQEGRFRRDLFYRLNVFPLEMPPLRKRKEDIPLLAEYFINRFARKSGKKIHHISRPSLEQLTAYAWPGNIRELQNIIERSVIVADDAATSFAVDRSWLSATSSTNEQRDEAISGPGILRMSPEEERKTIEAALSEAHGRVSGPTGAAARLGVPASTLDSKIKALKINKHQFK